MGLLVTVDGSVASEAVVPVAAEWSRMLGLQPLVVQVVPPTVGVILERAAKNAAERARVRQVAERLPDADGAPQWEMLHGEDVAASLLDYVNRSPVTLVAMATHGRTGLARITLGSVAMRVVHGSHCPVLVFRSPHLST